MFNRLVKLQHYNGRRELFATSKNMRAVTTMFIDETLYDPKRPSDQYVIFGYRLVYYHNNAQNHKVVCHASVVVRDFKFAKLSSIVGEDVDTKKVRHFKNRSLLFLRLCILN